jgi:hypothetical protein
MNWELRIGNVRAAMPPFNFYPLWQPNVIAERNGHVPAYDFFTFSFKKVVHLIFA